MDYIGKCMLQKRKWIKVADKANTRRINGIYG